MRQTLGAYRLERQIAVGGMGEVWLATGPVHDGPVVIKALRPDFQEEPAFLTMFFDEARITSSIEHPNIARIYELGVHDGEYFLVMEWVDGLSLHELMTAANERGTSVPLELLAEIAAQAAGALAAAHAATTPSGQPLQIIHRDVSPGNILVGFDGRVKLIDFGIAKAANRLVRTTTGKIRGKYGYMSPEQAYGQPLDGRSDVFALGVVLWECLCGRRLFKRSSNTKTLQAVTGDAIPAPSKLNGAVPQSFDQVLFNALERDVEQRFSAATFQEALEAWLARRERASGPGELEKWLKPFRVSPPVVTARHPAFVPERRAPVGPLPPSELMEWGSASLEPRLKAISGDDRSRGLLFGGLREVLGEDQTSLSLPSLIIDALTYPTQDLLRLLWAAGERLQSEAPSTEEVLRTLGAKVASWWMRSSAGDPLRTLSSATPEVALEAIVATLDPLVSPGRRTFDTKDAAIRFEGEVLPVAFYEGLLGGVVHHLTGRTLQLKRGAMTAGSPVLYASWP